jgi:hypothetical protein
MGGQHHKMIKTPTKASLAEVAFSFLLTVTDFMQ